MLTSSLESASFARAHYSFEARGRALELGRRTILMGVVNVTPDSFFGDSRRLEPDEAVERSLAMVHAGADIIDVGGESTRPGAVPVSADEELERVVPVLTALRHHTDAWISIDTRKSQVAEKAVSLGADVVNDVSGLNHDPRIAEVVAEARAGIVLTHMKGNPEDVRSPTSRMYEDIVREVKIFLASVIQRAEATGIAPASIVVDPGIGFGKTSEHNLRLLNRLHAFASLDKPILIGTSRKTFIGKVLGLPAEQRLYGTAATVAASVLRGAHIVRVHDVNEMAQIVRMADAILNETVEVSPPGRRVEAPE